MYVRTKKGEIFVCYESEQMHKPIYYPKNSKTNGYIDYNEVYKKSDNIIDILEVGDYVNGYFIEDNKGNYLETSDIDGEYSYLGHIEYLKIYPTDIKSIVTKEQFESMEYKIEEK